MAAKEYKTIEQVISDVKVARLGILNLSTAEGLDRHVRAALRTLATYLPDDAVVIKASRGVLKVKTTPCSVQGMADLTAQAKAPAVQKHKKVSPAKPKKEVKPATQQKVLTIESIEAFLKTDPHANMRTIGSHFGADRRRVGEVLKGRLPDLKAKYSGNAAPNIPTKISDALRRKIIKFANTAKGKKMKKKELGEKFGIDRRRVGEILKNA